MTVKVVYDVKPILKALNELEPGLKKEMIREFKVESKDMVRDISSTIRDLTPPPGSTGHSGRLSWESGKYKSSVMKPDNVIPRFRASRSRRFAVTALFAIWVRNPMVALTGTIGKGSMTPRRSVTREYAWKDRTRSHKLNGQGKKLLQAVNDNTGRNWFYRQAEKSMPDVEHKVKLVWEKYSAKVTRRL